ncbi:hypothetical protein [Ureibacillus chungkukjangi]|uniref:Uncharacterized protein n=1 Tax=Ureibacillus chungkukjangi TaxID=1202712 RepID=A0A318TMC2_9BACL|nr:hypothetical protein [Ureibacillus chungkukjangi]PYF05633.1 hypothetical protein BJ095_11742 [Ureibacillus chungkukjangi]
MKLLHNTKNSNATSIINSQTIHGSIFNIKDYLEEFFEKVSEANGSVELLHEYDDGKIYVPWLGSGVYCYSEFDIRLAKEYKKKQGDRTVIAIEIDSSKIDENNLLNIDSQESRKILKEFLDQRLKEIAFDYFDKGNEQLGDSTLLLREILIISFDNYYVGYPFAAGIILDLFLNSSETQYNIVKGSFRKGGGKGKFKNTVWIDTYFTIKENNVISSLNKIC